MSCRDDDDDDDDEPIIIVCQGPPDCLLVGDDAIQCQLNGCMKCDRMYATDPIPERTVQ